MYQPDCICCQLKRKSLSVECLERVSDAIIILNYCILDPYCLDVKQINNIQTLFLKAHSLTNMLVKRLNHIRLATV